MFGSQTKGGLGIDAGSPSPIVHLVCCEDYDKSMCFTVVTSELIDDTDAEVVCLTCARNDKRGLCPKYSECPYNKVKHS